jgi:hypothetical protein
MLRVCWRELGGPPVQSIARAGLGTQVLTSLYKDVKLAYFSDGLQCETRLRLS